MKLTIVTITFNDPKGLEKTIRSLSPLLNSKLNWEHVIIDSSPELNKNIIDLTKCKHITAKPEGVYKALNIGIENSQGDYIWFLNGGDLLFSAENIMAAMNYLNTHKMVELLLCPVQLQREGKELYQKNPSKRFLKNIIGSNFLCHQGVIYKKNIFLSVGMFSTQYKIASDYEHYYKCYLKNVNTNTFKLPIGIFDVSGSSSNQTAALEEFKQIQKQFKKQLSMWVNFANQLVFALFSFRVFVFSELKKSVLGPPLYKVWLFIKR